MERRINEIIQQVLVHYKIPGLSLAVIKDGEVVISKGFGVTDLQSKKLVTKNTLFGIGSMTKSFTSALLAMILEHRKDVTWDTPVREILGEEFKFGEDFRTARATLRDILAHRMGIELGETDFSWMCDPMTKEQLASRVAAIPIAADFRTKMMYNNLMYGLAGHITEILDGGATWEQLIKARIFDLLGMPDACFIHQLAESDHLAKPHMAIQGQPFQIDLAVHRSVGFCAAAGAICGSAVDMGHWMKFHLQGGKIDDVRVIGTSWLTECHQPQFVLPRGKPEWSGYTSKPDFPVTETRDAYGLGWYCGTYREHRYIAHAGELFGYDGLMTLYPGVNAGVYTCFNGPGGEPAFICNQLLHYYISDLILELEPWLNLQTLCSFPEPWQPRRTYYPERIHTAVARDIPGTRCHEAYTGKYHHHFLGDINIISMDGILQMNHGRIGHFELHPNGVSDEFRLVGLDVLSFLHQVDLYAPSDWMMVHFEFGDNSNMAEALCCSLFESGPRFVKQNLG